jgi:hypothetical protein
MRIFDTLAIALQLEIWDLNTWYKNIPSFDSCPRSSGLGGRT